MGLFSRLASKLSVANEGQVPGIEGGFSGAQTDTSAAARAAAILAPVAGRLLPLEQTSDPVFSSRAMGDGVAIEPAAGAGAQTVVAPISGVVGAIFPTAHALAIASDDGSYQVMIHIGVDTVQLEGAGFEAHVAQGDHVEQGQPLVSVDVDRVRAAGCDATVFVVLCERAEGTELRERAAGPVDALDQVLWLN